MIAAAVATIIGAAAAGIPVYDRISQWRRSNVDSQRSKEGGCECGMLNSPSATTVGHTNGLIGVEVKISLVVPSDEKHLVAAVKEVQRALKVGLSSSIGSEFQPLSTEPKSDEKP
ncbi:hypothetical protein FLO80_10560 [Aquicoccus porphyridii]|uniref:Uncharacterized protein n=1 Tax=Aquicoccus porphyridii TaxID=1852029 RepID=A0A5A9ZGM9_9RHOB|nr:hypothetical protein [Aquicoccus porphyridii]KAA0916159.1 hypothetical protein FLO80_10560 [Aquicoccus porphyridii]